MYGRGGYGRGTGRGGRGRGRGGRSGGRGRMQSTNYHLDEHHQPPQAEETHVIDQCGSYDSYDAGYEEPQEAHDEMHWMDEGFGDYDEGWYDDGFGGYGDY